MKKIGILLISLIFNQNVISQSISPNPVRIKNIGLLRNVEIYIKQADQWAKENRVADYLITLSQQRSYEYQTYTIHVLVLDSEIGKFSPSCFTVIKGRCVLMHTGLENFLEDNVELENYIKLRYGSKLIDEQKFIDEQVKKRVQPDNSSFTDDKGRKIDLLPGYIPGQLPYSYPLMQETEIVFYKNMLVEYKQFFKKQ
ncbi:MAG: hypothetical protein ABIN91_23245 [Mucilaginibacter sp.]|uniref:hypothetical protein n=1 Tax=Mucilaginibacter sp. TaxID=1882438 RepID=UPI003263648A